MWPDWLLLPSSLSTSPPPLPILLLLSLSLSLAHTAIIGILFPQKSLGPDQPVITASSESHPKNTDSGDMAWSGISKNGPKDLERGGETEGVPLAESDSGLPIQSSDVWANAADVTWRAEQRPWLSSRPNYYLKGKFSPREILRKSHESWLTDPSSHRIHLQQHWPLAALILSLLLEEPTCRPNP